MPKPLRIVNYAVNGVGIGHVARLIAISRWLRRHCERQQVAVEIYFVTSTEAGGLLFREHFPYFKLPSRTLLENGRVNLDEFLNLAKLWTQQTIAALRPDLLLVDTFPQGYFEELSVILKQSLRTALIYRPLKESHANQPEFQSALAEYDAVLVPEYEQNFHAQLPARARHIGPIIVREREEMLSREEARRALSIPDDRLAVYISMGGGGDAKAEQEIRACYDALRDVEGLRLVIGAGPLYRGRCIYDERITWLAHGWATEFMAGFDLAVSAAGYNSFNELMYFGIPSVFLPQEKWADDQKMRAERAVRAGAAVMIDTEVNGSELRQAIAGFRDPAVRSVAARHARNLVPRNHARDAATEILRLLVPEADKK